MGLLAYALRKTSKFATILRYPNIFMPDDTTTSPAGTGITFPSGTEVYDSIMANIESDLLSGKIATLDDAYPNETADEKKARYERYAAAFVAYDAEYAKWEQGLSDAVTDYRKTAMKSAEDESKTTDESALSAIEQSIEGGASGTTAQK